MSSTTTPIHKATKITLVIAAKTEGAYEDALSEATRLINEGNLSGSNRNGEGAFYFDSSDVPETEMPLMG